MVDNWETRYEENVSTGELYLKESYTGQVKIEQTTKQTYLGFVISSSGDNMANIEQIKKKSIGVIRKIFNRLNSLNLQKYYFECAMILLNAILRPSILYACDVYYNLKERELREIERIEENFLRKVLKTTKGCPIVQLYLEMGHNPARLEIQKTRLLYMQYILQQDEDSTILKFFNLQVDYPTRGDWAATCFQDMKDLNISESFDEIKLMSKRKFTKLLKERSNLNALTYLTGKQRTKGKDITYDNLEMSEYLLPSNSVLTVEEKRTLFEFKNKMTNIPNNFPKSDEKKICDCGSIEDMEHIYQCEIINTQSDDNILPYQKIYSGNINEQIKVFRKMEKNMKIREDMKNHESPCDPDVIRCKSVVLD